MFQTLKRNVRGLLRQCGFDVVRFDRRRTFRGALEHIRRRGLDPATVIDVGVGYGTPELYEVFPNARLVLIEPLKEFEPELEKLKSKYSATPIQAVAASAPGSTEIFVHQKLEGSSLYREAEGAHVDGTARTVRAVTIDQVTKEHQLEGPVLLKIDVQGAELDVLRGASETLERSEYVLLESSLFMFFRGGPVVRDVLEFMGSRGFSLYDLIKGHYRPLDGALAQVDLAFVKTEGRFRQSHDYATRDQRARIESE